MVPLPLLTERDYLVAYSLGSGEEMDVAVVNAFEAAGVDVFDRPTRLADWVDGDVLESLRGTSNRPLYLCTRIWDHQVVITAEEVRIYASQVSQ